MPNLLRAICVAAVALSPAMASAASLPPVVYQDPQVVYQEPPMAMQEPSGPISADQAAEIAVMHGMARVDSVDRRIWDGNYKVKGTDGRGEDLVMRIDRETGEILKIDD